LGWYTIGNSNNSNNTLKYNTLSPNYVPNKFINSLILIHWYKHSNVNLNYVIMYVVVFIIVHVSFWSISKSYSAYIDSRAVLLQLNCQPVILDGCKDLWVWCGLSAFLALYVCLISFLPLLHHAASVVVHDFVSGKVHAIIIFH